MEFFLDYELLNYSLIRQHLEFLPECFFDLVTLTSIDLSYNRLKYLPDSMSKLVNLIQINLIGDQHAPECIIKLRNLFAKLQIILKESDHAQKILNLNSSDMFGAN